jgi:hypothetical protein
MTCPGTAISRCCCAETSGHAGSAAYHRDECAQNARHQLWLCAVCECAWPGERVALAEDNLAASRADA